MQKVKWGVLGTANIARILDNEKPYVSPEFSVKNSELMDRVLKEIGYEY